MFFIQVVHGHTNGHLPILWRRFEDGFANTTAIFSILNTATSVSSAEIYPQASSPI